MTDDILAAATKDDLILAMLAVLGGESRDVNERDLFLESWHAFPNTMRWVDTALPNPDTFTASLRRLDQRGLIQRVGKQQRARRGRRVRPRAAFDAGRSGVVKARVAEGGLERAGVGAELIAQVRRLAPDRRAGRTLAPSSLIAICVGLREADSRHLDEGALAELAFHKFPDQFAYEQRPEFPDLERIRSGIRGAVKDQLIDSELSLTPKGRRDVAHLHDQVDLTLDVSESHKAGDLKFADRIERTAAFQAWAEHRTLTATKSDELFRALRVPPSADPKPIADALQSRSRALRRIDKGRLADYLMEVARLHNRDVVALMDIGSDEQLPEGETGARE